jgi:GNAT superfamily N-acetyltransferase
MAETDEREWRFKSHRFLLIQELDAFPRGRRAGIALLEEATQEALRRGRTALVLQTPTESDARKWYRAHGFRSWPGGICDQQCPA